MSLTMHLLSRVAARHGIRRNCVADSPACRRPGELERDGAAGRAAGVSRAMVRGGEVDAASFNTGALP